MFSLIQLKSESEQLLAVCINVITTIRRRLEYRGLCNGGSSITSVEEGLLCVASC